MGKTHRYRRIRKGSYRKVRQTLLVFASTGFFIGVGLIVFFVIKNNFLMVKIGAMYILVAAAMLGLRGVFTYLDQQSRQRRCLKRTRQEHS